MFFCCAISLVLYCEACDLLADTAPVPVAPPTQAFAAVTVPKLKLQEVDFGRREPETSSAQRPACHSGVLERLNSIELDAGPPQSVAPASDCVGVTIARCPARVPRAAYQEALRTSQLGGAVAPTAQRPAQEHERDISPVRVPALTQPAVALVPWLPPRSGRTSLASQASDRSGAKAAWQSGGTPCHAVRSWVTQDAAPQNFGGDLDRTVAVVAEGDEPRGRPLVQKPRPSRPHAIRSVIVNHHKDFEKRVNKVPELAEREANGNATCYAIGLEPIFI